ncbi:hypothetical protein DPEC_G00373930 [Dallia pectoralis]|nr:hypothetical protein DPEC_G00373930 [Dallia pectoralis]
MEGCIDNRWPSHEEWAASWWLPGREWPGRVSFGSEDSHDGSLLTDPWSRLQIGPETRALTISQACQFVSPTALLDISVLRLWLSLVVRSGQP